MFEVTLLHTKDVKKWFEILDSFEFKDPHYLPGYLQIYENENNREAFMHFGGEGMLFVYGDSRNLIIYPFFKRSIADLPFYEQGMENLFDISSPYGYGGPLAQIEDKTIQDELWRGFYDEIGSFCNQNNIISEFSRLHPVFNNVEVLSRLSNGCTEQNGRIVYIDLTWSEEDMISRMDRTHRQGLYKAKQNNELKCFSCSEQEYAPIFSSLYDKTMARKRADARFRFSPDFFRLAFQILKDHIFLSYVAYRGEPIAAVLTITYGEICYAWLACSNHNYFHLHPNELCFHQSATEAKSRGCKLLILGGGYSGEDSLFRFKAGFSGLFKYFYGYKKIHHYNEYNKLVQLRNKYDKESAGNFFPEYRAIS
jgi:hypothetical protein